MKRSICHCFLALTICVFFGASYASAGFNFRFGPAGDGGVDVIGKGSGFSDRVDPLVNIDDWDIQDFVTNFMVIDNGATLGAATESGTFRNVTTNTTVNIISFQIDEDLDPNGFDNDIDFDTDAPISFELGDEMKFSMTAHFTPGTLVITDLVKGVHIDEGHTQGAGIGDESFGISTVKVIPEPSTIALAIGCLVAATIRRRQCIRV